MAEMLTFTTWLTSRGLRLETAQVMIKELGIESQELLRTCTESDMLRAELLSIAKHKFAFAMYAELHNFIYSYSELRAIQPTGSALVGVLCSMLNTVSQELSHCAQKLSLLTSTGDDGQLQNAGGVVGIGISDVCSLHPKENGASSQSDLIVGIKEESNIADVSTFQDDVYPVTVGCFQDNVVSVSQETWNGVYVTESHCVDPENMSNAHRTERPGGNAVQRKSRSSTILHKKSVPKWHTASHLQDSASKMYKCSYCQYSGKVKRKLTEHMKLHSTGKLHKCNICGKSFNQSSKVAVHMRTHTGERPYKCVVCGKAFTQSSNLVVHMRTHTGERPYKCSFCGKAYIQLNNMLVHLKSHKKFLPLEDNGGGFV